MKVHFAKANVWPNGGKTQEEVDTQWMCDYLTRAAFEALVHAIRNEKRYNYRDMEPL